MIRIKSILFLITLSSIAFGHVTLVYPAGGESFTAGTYITIQWQENVNHGQADFDLYFSSNNGASWQTIAKDLSHTLSNYNWQVPNQPGNQAKIRVVQDNVSGSDYESVCAAFVITSVTNIEKESDNNPGSFVLYPPYPNPFNGRTKISFFLPEKSSIEINIYNILGKKVTILINDQLASGDHQVFWDPGSQPSGIYYYTVKYGHQLKTGRLVYLK